MFRCTAICPFRGGRRNTSFHATLSHVAGEVEATLLANRTRQPGWSTPRMKIREAA